MPALSAARREIFVIGNVLTFVNGMVYGRLLAVFVSSDVYMVKFVHTAAIFVTGI
jgi:hypothetical protein